MPHTLMPVFRQRSYARHHNTPFNPAEADYRIRQGVQRAYEPVFMESGQHVFRPCPQPEIVFAVIRRIFREAYVPKLVRQAVLVRLYVPYGKVLYTGLPSYLSIRYAG